MFTHGTKKIREINLKDDLCDQRAVKGRLAYVSLQRESPSHVGPFPRAERLSFGTVHLVGRVLCLGGCPVCCRLAASRDDRTPPHQLWQPKWSPHIVKSSPELRSPLI